MVRISQYVGDVTDTEKYLVGNQRLIAKASSEFDPHRLLLCLESEPDRRTGLALKAMGTAHTGMVFE